MRAMYDIGMMVNIKQTLIQVRRLIYYIICAIKQSFTLGKY